MHNIYKNLKLYLTLIVVAFSSFLFSQDDKTKSVNNATVVAVGQASLTDTYLSPLKYRGTNISILNERIGAAGFINDNLLLRQQFYITTAFTKNPSSSVSEYYGDLSYNVAGLYPVWQFDNFRLLAGGGFDASLGGIYNVRNSNNPGSLKTSINMELAAMATYNWKRFTFRWHVNTPFAGMFFTPGYGQSYYEIFSLGNGKGTVQFASFNNYLALQNYFTVDVPLNKATVRVGYLGNYYKTDINYLYTNISTHQFVLGLALESLNFGGKRAKNSKHMESVFY